jgi:hypothetical protein
VDPRTQAFNWGDGQKVVKHLKEVMRFRTLHTYGYHGFFKPSLAEVFAQLPTGLEIEEEMFFETKGPETASDLNKEKAAFDAGFQVAETILYKQDVGSIPERDGSHGRMEFLNLGLEERLERTSWVVECGSSNDHMHLWSEYWDNPNLRYGIKVKEWEDLGSGFHTTIGYFGEYPVCVDIQWTKISGKWVAFYYACSQIVDHRMVDKWVRENFEGKAKDGRWAHTDVSNFLHCISDIDGYDQEFRDAAERARKTRN